MTRFVAAERGILNVDLVAFAFRKEDGRFVCYSADGNEIGTISAEVGQQLLGAPATGAAPAAHPLRDPAARARVVRKLQQAGLLHQKA